MLDESDCEAFWCPAFNRLVDVEIATIAYVGADGREAKETEIVDCSHCSDCGVRVCHSNGVARHWHRCSHPARPKI